MTVINNAKQKVARDMYLAGQHDTAIAQALNISVRTLQIWRRKALSEGDDWSAARLALSQSIEDIAQKEREFIALLINHFEQAFDLLKNPPESVEDAKKRLELLNQYARSYWQLKAPARKDDKISVLEVAVQTIKCIGGLALEQADSAAADFLSANADEITRRVVRQ